MLLSEFILRMPISIPIHCGLTLTDNKAAVKLVTVSVTSIHIYVTMTKQ